MHHPIGWPKLRKCFNKKDKNAKMLFTKWLVGAGYVILNEGSGKVVNEEQAEF